MLIVKHKLHHLRPGEHHGLIRLMLKLWTRGHQTCPERCRSVA
jgi:hypothetical protein